YAMLTTHAQRPCPPHGSSNTDGGELVSPGSKRILMMSQSAPQLWLRAPRRLRLARAVRRETTQETARLRHHRGDFRTPLPKARVCPETPTRHSASLGDAPPHHNLPIAPDDYSRVNSRKPAHDARTPRVS